MHPLILKGVIACARERVNNRAIRPASLELLEETILELAPSVNTEQIPLVIKDVQVGYVQIDGVGKFAFTQGGKYEIQLVDGVLLAKQCRCGGH